MRCSAAVRLVVWAGAVSLVGAGLVGSSASAQEEVRAYDAVTSAYGLDVTAANPSIPLGLVVQGSGPVAQAAQSSLPESDAFASFPYPGDTAAGLLPAVGSLYGIALPGYPLIASSSINDEDPKTANFPGIELTATSGDTQTTANAVAGSAGAGGTAVARVKRSADGSILADSVGHADAVALGNLFTIAGSTSRATVKVNAEGTLTRTSSLSVASIRVPGLALQVPKSTPGFIPLPVPVPGVPQPPPITAPPVPLPFGGQTLKAPELGFTDGYFTTTVPGLGSQKFAIPAQAALDALKAAGIRATYQAPVETSTSITAGSLTLSTVLPSPPANGGLNGETIVNYTLGRASAQVRASGATTTVPVADAGSAAPDGGTGDAGGTVGSTSAGATESGAGAAEVPAVDTPGGLDSSESIPVDVAEPLVSTLEPDAGGEAGPVLESSLVDAPAAAAARAAALFRGEPINASWIYLLFVIFALTAVGGASVLRFVGVRGPWTS